MAGKAKPTPDLGFLKTTTGGAAPGGSTLFAAGTGGSPPTGDLPITVLDDNPYQPAHRGDPTAVAELAEVIGQQGFHGELLARPHPTQPGRYQLAFGHQRRDAARQAGLRSVPVEVRELTDPDMAAIVVTENIHRQDLDPLQEAAVYRVLQTVFGLTHEQIAEQAGKERSYITKRLGLLNAPADVQALVRDKPDSLRAAGDLKQITDPATRSELIDGLRDGRLTTNDIAVARRRPAANPDPPAADHPVSAAGPAGDPAQRARLLKLTTALESVMRYREQTTSLAGDISAPEWTKLIELQAQVEHLVLLYRGIGQR